jgi:hypothetical protein
MIVVERCWTSGFVDRIYGRPQPHFVQLSLLRPRWSFDVRRSIRSNLMKLVVVLMSVILEVSIM